MKAVQIAAQLYTVREFTKTAQDLDKTLDRIKRIGYSAVQISGIGPIDPEKVKEIVDKYTLAICATHISYDRLRNDLDAVIKEHLLWNCKYVGLGGIPVHFRSGKEGYLTFVREFNGIANRLVDAGLQFVYHNHHFEFERFDGVLGLELLLQSSVPAFGFELDTYWAQAGGVNPADWIYKLRGRMQVIHLQEMAIKENKQIFTEIGDGNLSWPSILKACRETGIEWYIVEQDTCLRDPFESLAISRKYLLNLLEGAEKS